MKVKNDLIKKVRWRTGFGGCVGFCWMKREKDDPRNRKGHIQRHGPSRATYWIHKWPNQQVDRVESPQLVQERWQGSRDWAQCQGQCWQRWGARDERRGWDERKEAAGDLAGHCPSPSPSRPSPTPSPAASHVSQLLGTQTSEGVPSKQ